MFELMQERWQPEIQGVRERHALDRSPVVKSPSGREYKLWALKALVLALRTCRIERDRRGHVTKRWGRYTWWDDRKGRR